MADEPRGEITPADYGHPVWADTRWPILVGEDIRAPEGWLGFVVEVGHEEVRISPYGEDSSDYEEQHDPSDIVRVDKDQAADSTTYAVTAVGLCAGCGVTVTVTPGGIPQPPIGVRLGDRKHLLCICGGDVDAKVVALLAEPYEAHHPDTCDGCCP